MEAICKFFTDNSMPYMVFVEKDTGKQMVEIPVWQNVNGLWLYFPQMQGFRASVMEQ